MTEAEYQKFVRTQKNLADAYVSVRLSDLCERNGFSRGDWRRWKNDEIWEKVRKALENAGRQLAALGVAFKAPIKNEDLCPTCKETLPCTTCGAGL